MAKLTASRQNKVGVKPLRVWDDEDGTQSWFDTEGFALYALEVHLAIAFLGEPRLAQIRRRVIMYKDEWLMDAISTLVSAGLIEEVRVVSPLTWQIKEAPVMPKQGRWNNAGPLNTPKQIQPLSESLYGDGATF